MDPKSLSLSIAMIATVGLVVPVAGEPTSVESPPKLRIATWGGAYGAAQQRAILDPVAKQLRVKIESSPANGAARQADLYEVSQGDLIKGCKNGSFAKISTITLKPGLQGESAATDFLSGSLSDCGVASFAWSSLFVIDRDRFKKGAPRTLSDVVNTREFPGKRAFIRRAENLFELLAVANGAPVDGVYQALRDRKQLDKVIASLNRMLPDIVWVDGPRAAMAKLSAGDVKIAMTYSGRAFRTIVVGNVAPVWDAHVYHFSSWALSATARAPQLGKTFIALATSPEYLAAQSRLWPYGPMRKSAVAMVGSHQLLGTDLAPFLPTSAQHLPRGVRHDAEFWAANSAKLNDRITALLEGLPLGIRVPPPGRKPEPPAPADTPAASTGAP